MTHGHAVLSFYTGGSASIEQNGAWRVREGDALLVPAGEPHLMVGTRRAEFWGLGFSAPSFAADVGIAPLLEPFERVREGASAVVHVPSERHEHLAGLFRELERTGREPGVSDEVLDAIQRSLLTLVLAEIAQLVNRSEPRPARGGVVAAALRFIERNCLGPLTSNDVAAAIGRSPTYVTAALTRATGCSAGEWIAMGRMAEARRILLHSDERIDAVAERVGYADVTHFIRTFRRRHGATPSAWRASQRAETRGPGAR